MKLVNVQVIKDELERLIRNYWFHSSSEAKIRCVVYMELSEWLDSLEVKEVDERIEECPYRQVGCTMYEGKILECRGACSWVVDYPKLKELKAQKGENAKEERYIVGVTGKYTTTTK